MSDVPQIFDRPLLARRRARATAGFAQSRFLYEEAGARLLDRLDDFRRHFTRCAVVGAMDGFLGAALATRAGMQQVIQIELCEPLLARDAGRDGSLRVVADEEALPLAAQSCDLIVSVLALQWVNDLPGVLAQIHRALRPDGLFLAVIPGGDTLCELRQCLMEAELALRGGVSPRLSPLIDVRSAGGLLQRTGFALPVVDREQVVVEYEDPFKLLADLRASANSHASHNRARLPLRRAVLLQAMAEYRARYGLANGRCPATAELIFLSGWAPHDSQQKPLRPGSAEFPLAELLKKI